MRNISFHETQPQFRARTKRVTRRRGWATAQVGDVLMGVEKGQGLKKGETVVKLGPIRVLSVRRERVDAITQEDCALEGFPEMTPDQFVAFFCKVNRPCEPHWVITRLEFDYE